MEGLLTNSNSGYGYGYGYGYGDGYGDGSGDGDGYGDGYGYGEVIGRVASYAVELLRPFGVLKVGCQVWTIDEWKNRFKAIARNHNVKITEEQVDEMLKKIEVPQ